MLGDERPQGVSATKDRTAEEAARLLTEGEMEILGMLPNASNHTFLSLVREEDEAMIAVYKPRRGERPLWDFPDGTLCLREVAAYEVSSAIGWPRIPPTVLREGPEGPGAVQMFVDLDPSEHYFALAETRWDELADDFRRIALFDTVVNNADRKAGHCLLGPEGNVYAIDHGVCFAAEPKLRSVIWEFADEPIPAELLEDLRRFSSRLASGDVRDRLGALLTDEETRAVIDRLEHLLSSERFPLPGPGRPYPWPPV